MVEATRRTAIPLESNPDSFNQLAAELGLDTTAVCFHDVLGFDDDLLALIPHPVYAAVLLYPGDDETMYRKQKIEGSVNRSTLVHFRQRVMNQCGTMALLHSLANTPDLPLKDGPITRLFAECRGLAMDEAAEKLDALDISELHTAAALSGQSQTPPDDVHPEGAFSAFIAQDGQLVELDGWTDAPLLHGAIEHDLIHSVIDVLKALVESKQHIRFTLLALAPAVGEVVSRVKRV